MGFYCTLNSPISYLILGRAFPTRGLSPGTRNVFEEICVFQSQDQGYLAEDDILRETATCNQKVYAEILARPMELLLLLLFSIIGLMNIP